MSYALAMLIAGAKVLLYEQFGSYQGDWVAKVEYDNKLGWVTGSYGSCSGCDAFQAEFDYDSHDHPDDNYCNPIYSGFKDDCEKCQSTKIRLIAFGKNYLNDIMTQEEAEKYASRNLEWDTGADEMLKFIQNNKI